MVQVLSLDVAGNPSEWLTAKEAASYAFKGQVAWSLGETFKVMRGGINAVTGRQSLVELKPIISVRCPEDMSKRYSYMKPMFSREVLLRRDRHVCAYCGNIFHEDELTLDHIIPEARGGDTSFMNLVAACKRCNNFKGCRTPEEARMPLRYLPYVPSLNEKFILTNRVILADQQEFLMLGVSKNSRLRS